ncbi:MAG TPA: hypothetical protein VIO56_06050 [Methylotenera sp.]
MKLILHLGMPKTGSTSIQTFMAQNRDNLLALGVLYPKVNISTNNHNFISIFLNEHENIPRRYRAIYKDNADLVLRDADQNWQRIKNQIDKIKPKSVILSGEAIFRGFENLDKINLFKNRLHQITDDIDILVYVRQPSKQYISHVQQRLKASGSFPPPQSLCVREILENIETCFDKKPTVIAYERDALYRNDVVSDFIYRVLPEHEKTLNRLPAVAFNESISVESMSIMQDYRMENYPEKDNIPTVDSVRLLRSLRDVEKKYKIGTRPVLREELAQFIDHSSTDLLFLAEYYDVQFKGIDYRAIKTIDNNPYASLIKVSDICFVDKEVKKKILMLTLFELTRSDGVLQNITLTWISRYQGSFFIQFLIKIKSLIMRVIHIISNR